MDAILSEVDIEFDIGIEGRKIDVSWFRDPPGGVPELWLAEGLAAWQCYEHEHGGCVPFVLLETEVGEHVLRDADDLVMALKLGEVE